MTFQWGKQYSHKLHWGQPQMYGTIQKYMQCGTVNIPPSLFLSKERTAMSPHREGKYCIFKVSAVRQRRGTYCQCLYLSSLLNLGLASEISRLLLNIVLLWQEQSEKTELLVWTFIKKSHLKQCWTPSPPTHPPLFKQCSGTFLLLSSYGSSLHTAEVHYLHLTSEV